MNFSKVKMPVSEKDKKRYCKVYGNVISNYFTFSKDLISNTKEILNTKSKSKDFKTDSTSYQLAFLLSFGVQDTCIATQIFCELIKNQSRIIQKLSKKLPIKLLCLEWESLPAVIGVCQAVDFIINEIGSKECTCDFSSIQISVIDSREKWGHLCKCIIDNVNSYFQNIELEIVEDFTTLPYQNFKERIAGLDLVIIARFFSEDRCFSDEYGIIQTIFKEVKDDTIFFYFDTSKEKYYKNIKPLVSKTSFSELTTCQNLSASFDDLGDDLYHLDLPISWNTNFLSIMYSTWMKIPIQTNSFAENIEPTASSIPTSERIKVSEKGKTVSQKKKKSLAEKCNESVNLNNGKNICNQSNLQSEQTIVANTKKDVMIKPCSESDFSFTQNNAIKGKQETKPSTNNCNSDSANKGITKKQAIGSEANQSLQKSDCPNVLGDLAISQKVVAKAENEINSPKEIGNKNTISSDPGTVNSEIKAKTATSMNSFSTTKAIARNLEDENVLLKQTGRGNVPSSLLKASVSGKKKNIQLSENSLKNNSHLKTAASKEESKKKLSNKKFPSAGTSDVQIERAMPADKPKKSSMKNATLTKRTVKNHSVEPIKLTGKFAHKDLEKKNKDERHKMRAKNKSFAKHANFDYDDW